MAAEQLQELFSTIQSGTEIAIENVETFAPDVEIPGAAELLGKTETAVLGNGTAATVSQLAVETSSTTATTAGVGLLALEMPTAVAAVVPFLGAFAGMTLYNLAPEFWTNVSNDLMQAGETVGGKLRAFINSATGAVGFSENTLNIIKNALVNEGIFQGDINYAKDSSQSLTGFEIDLSNFSLSEVKQYMIKFAQYANDCGLQPNASYLANMDAFLSLANNVLNGCLNCCILIVISTNGYYSVEMSTPGTWSSVSSGRYNYDSNLKKYYNFTGLSFEFNASTQAVTYTSSNPTPRPGGRVSGYGYLTSLGFLYAPGPHVAQAAQIVGMWKNTPSEYMQPGAVAPNANDPISTTYPNLTPWNLPIELPTIYPIEVPVNNPNPTQQEAQNPDTNPEPAPFLDWLLQTLNQPEPNPNPQPEPTPEPDPDPQPVPEPLPVIDPVEIDPNPPDPNRPIPPSPIPIIPDLPTTVDSNAMFTVYAPSISQLNAFGGWLWSNNIIDMLLRIWQNPLEGIIAFQKVYAVPTVGSPSNIIVGYIDSEVSAPVVTSQFVTVNCGTLTVDEILHNATDYPPYTMMHIYLPFIGIVELDCNEFMNGSITVTYHIDVYTGTCLVEVASTRSPDMATPTIIYTFSGNASQQLPLTSSNFGGALNALVSTVSGVARMGSGGALNAISGLSTIGHSVSHEMIHIAHSGDLSANAGIMALRTPYLIIGRRNSYDANAYNELYGYPANKTVYLGNCSGFTRIKAGFLRSKATEEEKQEIMDLLKKGVIL